LLAQTEYYDGNVLTGLGAYYSSFIWEISGLVNAGKSLTPLEKAVWGLYQNRSGLVEDDAAANAIVDSLLTFPLGLLKDAAQFSVARILEAISGSSLADAGAVAAGEIAAGEELAQVASSTVANNGPYTVYQGIRNGKLYIGITRSYAARAAAHGLIGRTIAPLVEGLTYQEARGAEQLLIDYYGLGNLENIINSIAFTNPNFANYVTQGLEVLQRAGQSPIG
jgi:hypothetical protein